MTKKSLVVIGNGMVGHRFLELFLESGAHAGWSVVTFCEEPRLAYGLHRRAQLPALLGEALR